MDILSVKGINIPECSHIHKPSSAHTLLGLSVSSPKHAVVPPSSGWITSFPEVSAAQTLVSSREHRK